MKPIPLEQIEKSEEELRESMWIEVIKQTERLYAELANIHTEIEKKDRELRVSKSFTDNIIKSMKNMLIVSDVKGNIKMINEAVSELLGYDPKELIGQKIEKLFAREEINKKIIYNGIYPQKLTDGILDTESVFVTKSFKKIPMTFSCSPLKDEEEDIIGTVIVAQDLSRIKNLVKKAARAAKAYRNKATELGKAYKELQQLHKNLIQSEKLAYVGKLAAGVAHEINNPLTSVLGITSFLLKKIGEKSVMTEDLLLIVEETKRCKKIVEDLLEFSCQRELGKSANNINTIIEKSLAIIEKQPFFKNIKIIRKFEQPLPLVIVDKNQIKQVFMNMILNAQEAMPDGGTLTVESILVENRKCVEIKFIDTGHGIHKDDITRLFDPFFTTKSKIKGTGLGLSVSYSIVTRHGGSIDVISKVGKGSTFIVRLPIER